MEGSEGFGVEVGGAMNGEICPCTDGSGLSLVELKHLVVYDYASILLYAFVSSASRDATSMYQ